MTKISKLSITFAVSAVSLFAFSINVAAQKRKPILHRKPAAVKKAPAPAPPVEKMYVIAAATDIRVRLNKSLSSKTAVPGTIFTSTVIDPVYSTTGAVVIPQGSIVTGRVDSVRRASNGGNVGQIEVSFTELRLPNGRRRSINGSLSDVEGRDAVGDNEGGVSGAKMKHRKAIFIGGGGTGGAIIGTAIGGGKGALIGAIAGGAAGYFGEKYTKGKDANLSSGTEFTITLNQSISLPKFQEVNP